MPSPLPYCAIFALALWGLADARPARAGDNAAQVLREAYGMAKMSPPVARFDAAKSNEAFILDRSRQGILLFRYVRSREIFVLHRVPGPRGDMMLKNDLGAVMVRMSRVGGPVLFPGRRSVGVPTWRAGAGDPLGPQTVRLQDLRPALSRIAGDLAALLGHNMTISANGADEGSAWLYLDAALNVRSALARLVRHPDRKGRQLPLVDKISLQSAARSALLLKGGVLEIHLVSTQGFAGRPSSLRLAGFLSGKSRRARKD